MKAIETQNLSKKYKRIPGPRESLWGFLDLQSASEDFWAIRNANIMICKGERIGIVGKNGAGKTTLLRLLFRLTHPSTGEAIIWGRVVSLIEVGAGFHPELTALENAILNANFLGASHSEISSKIDEIFLFANLEKYKFEPLKSLSKGMSNRLGVSVALHLDSDILILDEALEGLDFDFRNQCLKKLRTDSGLGRVIILVTHDLTQIKELCDRTLWMEEGSIIMDGNTNEVISGYSA